MCCLAIQSIPRLSPFFTLKTKAISISNLRIKHNTLIFLFSEAEPVTKTSKHTTENSQTVSKTSKVSKTNLPTTSAPTSNAPTTNVQTTNAPTTNAPTTNIPTTNVPMTNEKKTNGPTTNVPTTNVPTTNVPMSNVPTTNVPTTNVPTTNEPTTNIKTYTTIGGNTLSPSSKFQTTKGQTVFLTTNYIDALHIEHDELVKNKTAAETRLSVAQESLETAQELSTELASAQTTIDGFVSRRGIVRAESSDSTMPAQTCSEIIEFITKIGNAVNSSSLKTAKVYAKRITDSNITCTTEEFFSLMAKKSTLTAAKTSTDFFVTIYKAQVKAIKIEINNLITELTVINSKLDGYGQTTLHHGTHHDHEDGDGHTSSMDIKLTTESPTTAGQTTYMSSEVPTKKMTPYIHTSGAATTTIIPQTTLSLGKNLSHIPYWIEFK